MKVFIFGSNGMLGNYVSSVLKNENLIDDVIEFTRSDYDLGSLQVSTLDSLLVDKTISNNDVVINCAGVIPQAAKNRTINSKMYFTINSLFPVILGQLCEKYNAKLIHITTDCVFSGKCGHYSESDIHDEINDYGMSKSLGELCKATIIRTSIVGEELTNKRSLLEWVKMNRNGKINGFINHFWNGVTCLELSKILNKIIIENLYWDGVQHIFSPRSVNKYELVSIINEMYNLNIEITPFDTDLVDKTLTTIYEHNELFNIQDLKEQISELSQFTLN